MSKKKSQKLSSSKKPLSPWVIAAAIGVSAVIIGFMIAYWQPMTSLMSDEARIKALVERAGVWGPLTFIAVQVLQIIIAPIPGQVIPVIAGALFGPWWGVLYSIVGAFLGFTAVFLLARKLGRPFVERFFKKEDLKKFDYLTKKGGPLAFFLIFLLPGFPDDIICYLAGLSTIPLRTLIFVSIAGRLPGYVLASFFGSEFSSESSHLYFWIAAVIAIIVLIGFWKRKQLEAWMRRFVHDEPRT